MKQLLLALLIFTVLGAEAQTTHDLDWFTGIGSNVDLTIDAGDTVRWTWTSPNHTVENNPDGTSVETFNSGFLGPNGSVFEYTFTVVGSNDYYCSVHGAGSMSGTITVQESLGIDDEVLSNFALIKNPVTHNLELKLPSQIRNGEVILHNLLGEQIKRFEFYESQSLQLDISNLTTGLYLVTIETDNGKQTKRFIKM